MAVVHLVASFRAHLAQRRVPLRVTSFLSSARRPRAANPPTASVSTTVITERIAGPPWVRTAGPLGGRTGDTRRPPARVYRRWGGGRKWPAAGRRLDRDGPDGRAIPPGGRGG